MNALPEPEPNAAVPVMPGAPGAVGPVPPGQRILTVDILRGFALFGILLVNMELFNQSILSMVVGLQAPATPLDQVARWFIAFFGEGKFYSMFAFLFGLGMALQYRRAQEAGRGFGRFWVRRMAVLLGIGLVHAYLFWVGDILVLYSVLGVLLLGWRNARPRTLLVWVGVFLLLPLVLNAALWSLVELGRAAAGGAAMDLMLREQVEAYRTAAAQADRIYATGGFGAVTAQRVRDMGFMFSTWPFMAFNVFAMMVLGLYAGRRRLFDDIPAHLPRIRRLAWWGLGVGLIGNFMYVYFGAQGSRVVPSAATLLSLLGQTFGAPALSVCYMATLTLLAERLAWRRRLEPLARVGRMALTNYLLQTLICTTLFYGYGFGLYGEAGIAGGIALTLVIYALLVVFSGWWLARFRFGPMEWLWRTLAYGHRQPMRLAAPE